MTDPRHARALAALASGALPREDARRLAAALCGEGVHCVAEEVCARDQANDDHAPACCTCHRWLSPVGFLDPPRDGRRVTVEVHAGSPTNGSEVELVVTYADGRQSYACDQVTGRVRGVDAAGTLRITDGTVNGLPIGADAYFVDRAWLDL